MKDRITFTLPLKKLLKLKRKLRRLKKEAAHFDDIYSAANERVAQAEKDEESVQDAWDAHSHQICDALGSQYFDDGAGLDYERMITGIATLRQDLRSYQRLRQKETEEREQLKKLFVLAHKWAAQGSRSRWHTKASLSLWDKVRELTEHQKERKREEAT